MAEFVYSHPTARTRHRCLLCGRQVMPGETYWRQAGFSDETAWTVKVCEHCERVAGTYCRATGADDWFEENVWEWLEDEYPALSAAMAAGWRFPDGELVLVPFGSRCRDCGCRVAWPHLWCGLCDEARIARAAAELTEIRKSLKKVATS